MWEGSWTTGTLHSMACDLGQRTTLLLRLLRQLQPIHDYSLPSEWAGQLERLARNNGLEFKGVEYYSGAGQ